MKHVLGMALMIGALAGCLGPDETVSDADDCGAAEMQALLGTPIAAQNFSGHAAVRILPPGSMVTMDYRPDRLNIEHDASGAITRIACG